MVSVLVTACQNPPEKGAESAEKILRLATTTSTVNSGLFDVLIPVFERKYSVKVQVFAKGTGAALKLASEGGADVVLAHAREAEDKFIAQGFGINRRDVMYNDFVILGPPDDPAMVKSANSALEALHKIADHKQPFLSRGDDSGTNKREQNLWELAGITPHEKWYKTARKGMLETLRAASAQNAYVLSDRSTFLFNQDELDMVVLCQGDQLLFNPYGVIVVNPKKNADVNYQAAMQFVDFITSAEGQEIIRGYGTQRFGKALFTPLAVTK